MRWIRRLAIWILALQIWILSSVSYTSILVSADDKATTGASVSFEEPNGQMTSDGQSMDNDSIIANPQIGLTIDNQNRYEGMERTYSEGYIPKVNKGMAYLVVPILCSGKLKNNCLRASLNLGDVDNTPFVYKNYEKTIYLEQTFVNDGSYVIESYVAALQLELKAERYNGSYPVTINVQGEDESGNRIGQEFTVYVTIADGKEKREDAEEEKTFPPKVVIQSCQFSKPDIQAGDEVTAEITLINTAKAEEVRDLVVTISTESEFLTLLDESDTQYVEVVPALGVFVVNCRFRINKAATQGQYSLELKMSYTDSKTNECSTDGKVMVAVAQPAQVQFDSLVIPKQVEVADTIEASVQVMNLGRSKVYNMRAILEADGLEPQGTLFVGDLEPGSMGTGSTQITVGSLSGGGSLYGKTEGHVTFYYEDEAGVQQSEVMAFQTTIRSPFIDKDTAKEDNTSQWWVIMAVILGVLGVFAGLAVMRKRSRRKKDEMVEEILEN